MPKNNWFSKKFSNFFGSKELDVRMNKKDLVREIKSLQGRVNNLTESLEKSSSAYLTDFSQRYEKTGYPTAVSYTRLLQIYQRESWVRASVDVIKRTALAKGFRLEVRSDQERREDVKSIINLFEKPNDKEGMKEIIGDIITDLHIFGDSYLEKVKDRSGLIQELYNMSAQSIRVICDPHGDILGYLQVLDSNLSNLLNRGNTTKSKTPEWGPGEMSHFKLPNPGNEIYGLSPLESLMLPIECDLWAQLYNRSFFMNDATPRGHLDLGNCTKQQIERIKQYWQSELKGSKNAHKTIITEGGAKYTPVGTAPKDMEFLNQRRFNRDEILAVYGVPPSKVCVFENVNRSSGKEADKNFKSETIAPLQELISEKINKELVWEVVKDKSVVFKFNEVDIRNEEEQSEIDEKYWIREFIQ